MMKHYDKLDKVLNNLAEHNLEFEQVYDFYFDEEIKKELRILLGQIVKDGFANVKEISDPEMHEGYGNKVEVYRISSEGLHFANTSSYKEKHIKEQQNKFWNAGKKAVIIINAVLLLFAAIAGVYISNKANEDKEENKQLKRTIDSLTSVIQMKNERRDTIR
jgi:hypothetical protein